MERAAIVEAYLAGLKGKRVHPNTQPFVTISRESGAGANELADTLLRILPRELGDLGEGWQKFDQGLCNLVAGNTRLGVSLDELVTERYRSEIDCLISDLLSGSSQQYAAYKRMFQVIRILATLGKVIVVGRGGSQITRNMPLGVHVRLVASVEHRIRAVQESLKLDRDAALKRIKLQDRDRERLIRDFFDRDINDPHNYDVVLASDRLSMTDMAQLVATLIRQRATRKSAAPA